MVRSSQSACTRLSSSVRADHLLGVSIAPEPRLIVDASRSPHHGPLLKLVENTKLLPGVGSRVETPSAPPEATIPSTSASAFVRPLTTEFGSLALKNVPRPLTAVCQ